VGDLLGIDVYEGNGPVIWSKVAGGGYAFGMRKATEGATETDSKATKAELAEMMASGLLVVGFYHFAFPENGSDWEAEAAHYLRVCEKAGVDWDRMVPIIDIERNGPIPEGPWVQKWCDYVEARCGRRGLVYAGYYFWRDNAHYGRIKGWKRWTPWYDRSTFPPGDPWPETFIWQSSDRVHPAGTQGNIDQDRFAGGKQQLKRYLRGQAK